MSESMRILIVDDESGMRLGAQRALLNFSVQIPDVNGDVHFEVDSAGTGGEALKKIGTTAPDILLLDHKLPDISGLEILSRIAQPQTETLTIMITAYASLDTAITATKRGAFDFLAKPFTPTELKASIRKAVRHLLLQRHARRLAQEKRQVRFQFISVLAHELKAPLAAVEGYLNLISDRSLGDNVGEYNQMLGRSLERVKGMQKMILDLLDLTRIEAGTKTRELTTIDVTRIAQTAIHTASPEAQARNIAIQLQAPDTLPMIGDTGELEIIFNNLLSNAVKYNLDGGRVDLRLTLDQDNVLIVVTDTGIGMSSQECARLFQDFVRIKNDKTRTILGSGLGLSIVRKLAQLYSGQARVESTPGQGSTFTVALKQKPAAEHKQP